MTKQQKNGKALIDGLSTYLGITFSAPAFIVLRHAEPAEDSEIPVTVTFRARRGKVSIPKVELRDLAAGEER